MHDSYDITIFDEIDSTNNEAKRRIADAGDDIVRPFVLAAHSQTAGRGRQGKSFYSPKGTGIYLTAVCPVDCPIEGQVTMTTKAAVAVSRAIEGFFGVGCAIKWVNDIFINDRKCCGILCEAVNDYEHNRLKFVVIGVGVNVSTSDWPADIADTAGSIRKDKLTDDEFRAFAERLAVEILKVIYEPDGSEMSFYRDHSYVIGREISFSERINTENGDAERINTENGDAERENTESGDTSRADFAGTDTSRADFTGIKTSKTDSAGTEPPKADSAQTITYTATAVGIDDNGGLIVKLPSGELKKLDSGEITVRVQGRG